MKIKIKSLDNFKQNYEKLFKLEKIINFEEKKNIIIKMNTEIAKSSIKMILQRFIVMDKLIPSKYSKIIKIHRLPTLQNNFEESTKFLQKKFKKKMEKQCWNMI